MPVRSLAFSDVGTAATPHGSLPDGSFLVEQPTRLLMERTLTYALAVAPAALRGSREVGMAMGIVMERHRLDPDEALQALRRMSSARAVGLREVAAAIVHRRPGR